MLPSGAVAVATMRSVRRDRCRKHDVEGRYAAGVGRDDSGTEVAPTFAVAGRIGGGIGVEVDPEGRVRGETRDNGSCGALDPCVRTIGRDRRDRREVLQVVCARVGVVVVVARYIVAAEVDAEVGCHGRVAVVVDRVTDDGVADRFRRAASDAHAIVVVAADSVSGAGRQAADEIEACVNRDLDAVVGVRDVPRIGRVTADDIAGDHVVVRAGAGDVDAVLVARDDVPGPGDRAADEVLRRTARDPHAVRVRERCAARVRRADVVAEHCVAARSRAGDLDAGVGVAGDDVTGAGARPADDVVRSPGGDVDPVPAVRASRRAVRERADVVAPDQVLSRRRAADENAVQVSGDDVAFLGRRAPDRVVRAKDLDTLAGVRVIGNGQRAVRVEAPDVVADDHVVVGTRLDRDPVVGHVADHETADDAAARPGRQRHTVGGCVVAVDHDDRVGARIVGLRPAVDRDPVSDARELRSKRDRVRPRPGDSECDGVGAGRAVCLIEGPAQRACNAGIGSACDRERREHPVPQVCEAPAHNQIGLDLAGPKLELPVPAPGRCAGQVLGGRHIRPGKPGHGLKQRLALLGCRQIATVKQDVALLGQRRAPLLDRRRALDQRLEVELRAPELHRAVLGVADDVDRIEIALPRQRVGDLANPVALLVDQHELEVAPLREGAPAHAVDQLLVVGRSGVDEDELVRPLDRGDRAGGDDGRGAGVGDIAELGAGEGGGGEEGVTGERVEVRGHQEPGLELLQDGVAGEGRGLGFPALTSGGSPLGGSLERGELGPQRRGGRDGRGADRERARRAGARRRRRSVRCADGLVSALGTRAHRFSASDRQACRLLRHFERRNCKMRAHRRRRPRFRGRIRERACANAADASNRGNDAMAHASPEGRNRRPSVTNSRAVTAFDGRPT